MNEIRLIAEQTPCALHIIRTLEYEMTMKFPLIIALYMPSVCKFEVIVYVCMFVS